MNKINTPIFGMIPISLLKDYAHKGTVLATYTSLSSFQGGNKFAYPGIDQIAERASLSESAVISALKILIKDGWVERKKRFSQTNLYSVKMQIEETNNETTKEKKVSSRSLSNLKQYTSPINSVDSVSPINSVKRTPINSVSTSPINSVFVSPNNSSDIKEQLKEQSKRTRENNTDFSCFDLLKSYYEYLKEKGFSLSENFVDRAYVNNFQNDSAYSNLQLAKNKSKYLLMLEDAKDLFEKILFIEETAKSHPQLKQDTIYRNIPKAYYLGSVLKGRLSILNVFGKCQEIALKPPTLRGSFYDGVNVYDSPENRQPVASGVLGDDEDDIW
jgi:hypothetical protein